MAITQEDIQSTWDQVLYHFERIRTLLDTPEQESIGHELDAAGEAIKNLQRLAGYSQEGGPVPFRITVHDEQGGIL